MRLLKVRKAPALLAMATILLSACGSDSTGPRTLDSNAALQSLLLALGQVGTGESPSLAETDAAFTAIVPLLDQVDVTINGTSQSMYAFAWRESFPAGTCLENLFSDPFLPDEPGVCTPTPPEIAVILWQSHAALEPPDKLIVFAGDIETTNFDFTIPGNDFPGFAIYLEGEDKFWTSTSGTLRSQVASTNQTCGIPLPPYAKSGDCTLATFTEQGSVVFSDIETFPSTNTVTIGIPQITLHGLWLSITEVQQVQSPWDYSRSLTRGLSPLSVRVLPLAARGKSRISGRP